MSAMCCARVMHQKCMPAPAVEEREARRDLEFDRPGDSVIGPVAGLRSFQFNVRFKARNFPRARAIATYAGR
jgi:hypothetical protein